MGQSFLENFILGVSLFFRELGKISYKGVRYVPSDYRYRRGIDNLKARGLVRRTKDKTKFDFTDRGKLWINKKIHPYFYNKKWDKKWRVIIFDIPSEIHKKRNIIRKKLKTMGCVMLQKSIFVFPYPCDQELGEICNQLGISDYVDIILADSIGSKEIDIRKYFNP